MDTIAEHLGISKRTIYELFKTKDDLLEQGINYRMAEEEKYTQEILAQSSNVFEAFLTHIKRNIQIMYYISPMFFHDAQKYHSEVFRCKGKEREKMDYNRIVEFIQQSKQEGYIKSDINEDIFAKLMKEQVKIIGNDEIFPPDQYSKAEIFENISINSIRGIATEKGLKLIDELNI